MWQEPAVEQLRALGTAHVAQHIADYEIVLVREETDMNARRVRHKQVAA